MKISEKSVINCGARLQGGIIKKIKNNKNYLNETPNPMEAVMKEFSVHLLASQMHIECFNKH